MILVIDNYDSFVHNLARYVRREGFETLIIRNDEAQADELLKLSPSAVIISPGPKAPRDAGCSMPLIRALAPDIPFLGVCLGHQCLVEAFGGATTRSIEPMHGEASLVRHDGRGLFEGVASPMEAGRYHSLIARPMDGGALEACAWSAAGEVMAVRRRGAPWHGVQFHPESLLTPDGRALIANFARDIRKGQPS